MCHFWHISCLCSGRRLSFTSPWSLIFEREVANGILKNIGFGVRNQCDWNNSGEAACGWLIQRGFSFNITSVIQWEPSVVTRMRFSRFGPNFIRGGTCWCPMSCLGFFSPPLLGWALQLRFRGVPAAFPLIFEVALPIKLIIIWICIC